MNIGSELGPALAKDLALNAADLRLHSRDSGRSTICRSYGANRD